MHTNRAITADAVELLRSKLTPLLERLAAESGLSITMGKITYTRHNAVFAVEAAVRGEGGIAMGREAEAFLTDAMRFGLDPSDLGRDFEHFDQWYRIVGLKPRSTKTPVVCQRITPPQQNRTLFPAHVVRHYLERGGRERVSPHARVRVEIVDEPPGAQRSGSQGELPALPE